MVREREGPQTLACVSGHADVDAAQGFSEGIFCGVIGGYKGDVQITPAGAIAGVVVDLYLRGNVGAVGGNQTAGRGECRGINRLADPGRIRSNRHYWTAALQCWKWPGHDNSYTRSKDR